VYRFEEYSETPEADVLKCMLNLEIMSGHDFDHDFLYVHYLIDLPDGWLAGDATGSAFVCVHTDGHTHTHIQHTHAYAYVNT
jgi:hypothetical protein